MYVLQLEIKLLKGEGWVPIKREGWVPIKGEGWVPIKGEAGLDINVCPIVRYQWKLTSDK
jgi:hypothetical protein